MMSRGDECFGEGQGRGCAACQPVHLICLTRKGNRPSYIRASKPEIAVPLYEK